jgi:predicted GTPase
MRGRKERMLILGAAGRDFHNFNTVFRDDPEYEVVGFTAAQIPGIEGRRYPPELSGKLYPKGLPIWSEEEDLDRVIKDENVDRSILSYSDLSYNNVMELGARVQIAGSEYDILPPTKTMLRSSKPVVAVTAVRTGAGKSQVSRYVTDVLQAAGKKTVLVRHPMPYGNLAEQAVQRFATFEDLDKYHTTIEEREEYEQHISHGSIVYAGVDYEAILRQAEKEADVIIWDGGNNDTPFYFPELWIVVADPLRAGHEISYWPGDINFRMADVVLINKANTAPQGSIDTIKDHAKEYNPRAPVVTTNSTVCIECEKGIDIKGKKAVTVDDGPTLTHGGMAFGAGKVAAEKAGVGEIVDPRPYFKGSMIKAAHKNRNLGRTIPAMGYSPQQCKELEETINAVPADVVIIATPTELKKLIKINKPTCTVRYTVEDRSQPPLSHYVKEWLEKGAAANKEERIRAIPKPGPNDSK